MANEKTREVLIEFKTNAPDIKKQLEDVIITLDNTSVEYQEAVEQLRAYESALEDVNNALLTENASQKELDKTVSNATNQWSKTDKILSTHRRTIEGNSRATKDQTVATKSLTSTVTENGGAMAILSTITGGWAMTVKDGIEAMGVFNSEVTIGSRLQQAYAAVVGTSTGALKAFRIALAATGIGLAVVAIAALVTNWDKLTGKLNDAEKAQEAVNDAMAKANTDVQKQTLLLNTLLKVANDNNISLKDRKRAIGDIIAINPEYLGGINAENVGTAEGTRLIQEYISFLGKKMELQALSTAIQKTYDDELKASQEDYSKWYEPSKNSVFGQIYDSQEAESKRRVKAIQSILNTRLRLEQEYTKKALETPEIIFKEQEKVNAKIVKNTKETVKEQINYAEEYIKSLEKIRTLSNEAFGNKATNLISDNEKKINEYYKSWSEEANNLKTSLDKGVIDIDTFDKNILQINKAYKKLIGDIDSNNRNLLASMQFANNKIADFPIERLSLDPDNSLKTVYDLNEYLITLSKTISDVTSKNAFDEIFDIKTLQDNNKVLDDLFKKWEDFNGKLTGNTATYDDSENEIGQIKKVTQFKLGLLEEEEEAELSKLLTIKAISEEEAQLMRDNMDLSDELANTEIENDKLEIQSRIDANNAILLSNISALESQKYFANQRNLIIEEGVKKEEEAAERKKKINRERAENEREMYAMIGEASMDMTDSIISFGSQADQEQAKSTVAYKGLAIAQTTMTTYSAAMKAYESYQSIPIYGQAMGIAAAASTVAMGLANVKKILSVKVKGANDSSSASLSTATTQPNVKFVSSDTNQISNSVTKAIGNQANEPLKAYVTVGDIDTAQQLQRQKVDSNSI